MDCRYPDGIFRGEEKECREIYEYEIDSDVVEFPKSDNMADLSIMRFFPQVRDIYVEGNNVSNLDFVKYLPRLRELHARRNPIQSIDPLKGKDMVALKVDGDGSEFNISILSDMRNLEVLSLGGSYHDLSPLANLTKLRSLFMGFNSFDDICVIRNLTALEVLYIHNSDITDILCLDNFNNLRRLMLDDNNLTSVKAIADNFPYLEVLSVDGNPISDLSPLVKLKKLRSVFVDTDKLKPCSPKNIEEIEAGKSCDNFWLIRFIDWIRF
jgi:internalin A